MFALVLRPVRVPGDHDGGRDDPGRQQAQPGQTVPGQPGPEETAKKYLIRIHYSFENSYVFVKKIYAISVMSLSSSTNFLFIFNAFNIALVKQSVISAK